MTFCFDGAAVPATADRTSAAVNATAAATLLQAIWLTATSGT